MCVCVCVCSVCLPVFSLLQLSFFFHHQPVPVTVPPTTMIIREAQAVPASYLLCSILVTLFCCPVLGIIAIVKSSSVSLQSGAAHPYYYWLHVCTQDFFFSSKRCVQIGRGTLCRSIPEQVRYFLYMYIIVWVVIYLYMINLSGYVGWNWSRDLEFFCSCQLHRRYKVYVIEDLFTTILRY